MKKPKIGQLLIALALVLPLGLLSQEADLKWNPTFSMQFRQINGTDLSPDGKHVAYVVREALTEGEKSEYLQQVWVAATDGSMEIQYTRGEKSSYAPAFSPDGQRIAFLSGRSGKTQIWVMRLMGGEAEQITDSKTGIASFQWSPQGDRFAFTAKDEETAEEEKAKKEKRAVILVDQNFKYNHLYTIDLEPGEDKKRKTQRLTKGEFHISSFDWSPDGSQIVFAHKENPSINTSRSGFDISMVASDSSAVRSLVAQDGSDDSPHFSPDGRHIAFVSDNGKPEPIGLGDLYLYALADGKMTALPHTPDRNANLMGWTADGQNLLFSAALNTSRTAMILPINDVLQGKKGKGVAKALCPLDGTSGAIAFDSKTQKMAFAYQTPDQPVELHVANADGSNKKAITTVNSKIELPAMGKTELIKWKSKDGLEVEGLLTYPVNYEPGKKYPTILQIHGGPAGVFTKGFTGNPSIYLTQYFAEQGFFVLRPNPRGSSGYGKAFRYANFRDWGYGDFEDLMSGVDKVVADGMADEERLLAMGWSYGGYMTSFLVTKTNRFKAASMGAGLPNLISMTSTTDIPDYLVGHMGKEFWEDYETYEKHSAIYHIKNVETPTQVIHGANDLRVPFTQGQEFYVALKRRGVDTEMIVLPRTPHGPREPKLQMEVSPRIMGWFEKFLPEKAKP